MKTYIYTFKNIHTNHIFFQSNNLKQIIQFYHKVPKRKTTTILIVNNVTGEIIKMK